MFCPTNFFGNKIEISQFEIFRAEHEYMNIKLYVPGGEYSIPAFITTTFSTVDKISASISWEKKPYLIFFAHKYISTTDSQ